MNRKLVSLFAATLLSVASLSVMASPDTAVCPADFHNLTMPENAKQCQRFDTSLPATMVFYSSTSQQALIEHYTTSYPGMEVAATIQGRTLLTADNDTVRIIISPDHQGSQVDMMIVEAK